MATLEPKPLPLWANAAEVARRAQEAVRAHTLVPLVQDLYAEGYDEGEAYGVLERLRAELRARDREGDEDEVMEVMDRIVGYCSPGQHLRRDAGQSR